MGQQDVVDFFKRKKLGEKFNAGQIAERLGISTSRIINNCNKLYKEGVLLAETETFRVSKTPQVLYRKVYSKNPEWWKDFKNGKE